MDYVGGCLVGMVVIVGHVLFFFRECGLGVFEGDWLRGPAQHSR